MNPKCLTIFKLAKPEQLAALTEEAVAARRFTEIGDLQDVQYGWVQTQDVFVYTYANHTLLCLRTDSKSIPPTALKAERTRLETAYEAETGFAPGKRLSKELRERAVDNLLPDVPATSKLAHVWIDRTTNLVALDSVSDTRTSLLIRQLGQLGVDLENIDKWPSCSVMSSWILNEPPSDINLEGFAELIFPGVSRTIITYKDAQLAGADVRHYLAEAQGGTVGALAVTYSPDEGDNGAISFVLTSRPELHGITFQGLLKETSKDADAYQNNFYLKTHALADTIAHLIDIA